MNTGNVVLLASLVAAGAFAGVWLVRRYTWQRLLDVPNDRSSHCRPTPRGGGLGLVVAHLVGVLAASLLALATCELATMLIGGGLLVATVGLLDDLGHVQVSRRLICHLLAFVWAVWWLGGLPPVDFGFGAIDLGPMGTVPMLVYLVWFLNLFNFMDGIDGIAGAQALSMSVTASLLLWICADGVNSALPLLLLAAATGGFLVWNWPPAKIFMGDVGSGYLGFALGALALWTVVEGWLTVWVWLILGGAFLADATVTLLVRARHGTTLAEAHRSHAYQRLSRYWGSHRLVTLAFVAVNVVWLAPWALLAALRSHLGAACAMAALSPLFLLAARLGAGRPDEIGARE